MVRQVRRRVLPDEMVVTATALPALQYGFSFHVSNISSYDVAYGGALGRVLLFMFVTAASLTRRTKGR